jgi:plastocyanin
MTTRAGRARRLLAAAAVVLAVAPAGTPAAAAAQSLLERTPNISGGWVADAGQLHFHLVHRFQNSGAPERQVQTRPTFLLAAPLPLRSMFGVHYATRSEHAAGVPNEWELFVRMRPLAQASGAVADVGVQAGRNAAARSWDAELSAGRSVGRVTGVLALRLLSHAALDGDAAGGVALGGIARLSQHIAVAADAGRTWTGAGAADIAWSAGVHARLPATPHTISLHATNVSAATVHSTALPGERVRWGFEFTVPVTLRRWFGGSSPPAHAGADASAAHASAAGDSVVRVDIHNLQYRPQVLHIAAGTTVEWRNRDPLDHTVTAVDGSWDSGDIAPGTSWRRRFDTPGRYPIVCTPHPFMRAEVVVR